MTYFAQRHQSCTYCILWQFVRLSKASLPVSLEIGGSGTETMSDNYGEGATGCSQQRPVKSLHKSGEKSATGRIKTNRST